MANLTYRTNYEAGVWFEIQSLAFSIIDRAVAGQDTSRSREILKAWAKYPGYKQAAEVSRVVDTLLPLGKAVAEKETQGIKDKINKILRPTIYVTTDETPAKRGAPVKKGEVSRMTLWRRQQKEKQGVLIA